MANRQAISSIKVIGNEELWNTEPTLCSTYLSGTTLEAENTLLAKAVDARYPRLWRFGRIDNHILIFFWWLVLGRGSEASMDLDVGENIVGAIVFFAYIVAALALTSIVVADIFLARSNQEPAINAKHLSRHRPASLYWAAALISFSVLSWNMLSFLLVSYSQWAEEHQVITSGFYRSPTKFLAQAWYVWVWATSSTLFETFAENLLVDVRTWRRTMLTLTYHYACNMYMSMIGHQQRIPRLWAYFVLNQILPVSFSQNLFFTMMTLSTTYDSKAERKPRTAIRALRILAAAAYVIFLQLIPKTLQNSWFIPTLLLMRAILFAPFLIDVFSYGNWCVSETEAKNSVLNTNMFCLLGLTLFGAYVLVRSPKEVSDGQPHTNDVNYAATALSNDLSVGLVSFLLYLVIAVYHL